jgi:hypothetical protein
MKILFGVKKSRNIYGNNKKIKKVKTVSLFPVRNIHIGVVSFLTFQKIHPKIGIITMTIGNKN